MPPLMFIHHVVLLFIHTNKYIYIQSFIQIIYYLYIFFVHTFSVHIDINLTENGLQKKPFDKLDKIILKFTRFQVLGIVSLFLKLIN